MVHRWAPEELVTVEAVQLPPDQQGWRGLGIPGVGKRKWWTLLHTDNLLVTALLLLPGERSVRHSHESGELSVHFDDQGMPGIHWNPPGVIHAGLPVATRDEDDLEKIVRDVAKTMTGNTAAAEVLLGLFDRQRELKSRLDEMAQQKPKPRVIVDVLFPPFKTTIGDPAYPEERTVTGQWYD